MDCFAKFTMYHGNNYYYYYFYHFFPRFCTPLQLQTPFLHASVPTRPWHEKQVSGVLQEEFRKLFVDSELSGEVSRDVGAEGLSQCDAVASYNGVAL